MPPPPVLCESVAGNIAVFMMEESNKKPVKGGPFQSVLPRGDVGAPAGIRVWRSEGLGLARGVVPPPPLSTVGKTTLSYNDCTDDCR